MKSNQIQTQPKIEDNYYLEIWKADQEFVRTRWTITTFFMSASFAIFAYSFQIKPLPALAIRIFGLFIYWFAVIMHAHFYQHNKFLRNYLIYLEKSGRSTFDLQSKLYEQRKNKFHRSTGKFLAVLGLLYAIGIIWLFFLQI
ncbi:MAG TPA: hypothetical protein VKR83_08460 [Ktedonobacteraceae bacterium]|nr:hypothetical protein [Ktedonobacteraceae bacterium]